MRRLILAAILAGVVSGAQAADLPDIPILRGPVSEGLMGPRPVYWQGFYAGGHFATGVSDMNFNGATRDLAARLLNGTALESEGNVSSWPVLGKESRSKHGFGGFVGYTAQWDDVILGLEANYTHGKFGGSATDQMGRIFTTSNGYTNDVTYQASAGINITDMGSVRGRAGYAWGAFLPYAFGGVSLGVGDITRTARIFGTQVNAAAAPGFQNVPFDLNRTITQKSHFLYGYAAGLGMDVMLIGGLFGRVEYEYLKFTAPIDTSIHTAKAGLGYKF